MGGSNIVKVNMVREYQSNIRAGFPFSINIDRNKTIFDLKEACLAKNRKINHIDLKIRYHRKYFEDDTKLKDIEVK